MSTKPLEVSVERAIKRWADRNKNNLIYWKFQVPGMSGVPDRICLFRGGAVVFVELKRPGGKPRSLQVWLHKKLRTFGFPCLVFDNAADCIAALEVYLELHSREA